MRHTLGSGCSLAQPCSVFEVVQREFSAQSAENCHENIRFHEKRNALSSALKALSGKAFSFRGGRAKMSATLRAFAECTKPFAASSLSQFNLFSTTWQHIPIFALVAKPGAVSTW
jgi:hypothetical protein